MAMPIIPGLAGAPPPEGEEPPTIAQLLDALPDDELASLQDAADTAAEQGALADILGEDPEAPPADDEANETPAEETAESPDEQKAEADEGEEDPTPHRRAAEDAAKAAADALSELSALVEQAGQHEEAGVDVDALQEHLDEAEEAAEEAQKASDDAADADAEEAADLAQDGQEAAAKVLQCLAEAKASVAADANGAEDAAVPDEIKAMTAWAKQVAGML